MGVLLAISRAIDAVTTVIGRTVSWLILVAVLVSAGNAVVRKSFDMSSNAFLELQWYLYGTAFMLAAAYTLRQNEHVRIDVLSATLSKRARDWIDLVGHIVFLTPFAFLMVYLSWPFFLRSFVSGEGSPNASGLTLWPAKLVILVGFVLLSAQAISEIIKRVAVLTGHIDETAPPHELPPMVEEMADPHGAEIPGHDGDRK